LRFTITEFFLADKNPNSFLARLRNKYRLVILNDDTFEEKVSLKLSRLNVFIIGAIFTFALISGTILLIALTPLREYIPGYASTNLKREVLTLAIKTDSLEAQLKFNEFYISNIGRILQGEAPEDFPQMNPDSTTAVKIDDGGLAISAEDSLLRFTIEEEEKFNISKVTNEKLRLFTFFPPIKGLVTNGFDIQSSHFGVDIVAPENAPVKSCLSGVVVFAGWTSETGHVIAIQHQQDLVSIYKHNSVLLKKQGDFVKTGEAIALLGKTGHLSTGPHLHFELWFNGNPVNPENYIIF
jgi:murein DD-endopeptidase MepM/ murein hydrolase activator NlpD